MRFVIDLLVALVVAIAVGLATAWVAVEYGSALGTVAVGPWNARPEAGTPGADPYSAAIIARSGDIPLGAAEGIAFTAVNDEAGRPLTGACLYRVSGRTPPARLWTLTAYDGERGLMSTASRRTGFHSRELLREADGSFVISIATMVEPGNWLAVRPVERLMLVLRLYDSPLTSGLPGDGLAMPRIERVTCR